MRPAKHLRPPQPLARVRWKHAAAQHPARPSPNLASPSSPPSCARRHFLGTSEKDVEVPPLFRTALVWGLFMGLSSNLRYQVVFGLERLVDMTVARKVPQVAYGTTVAIRFVNNVIGARLAGGLGGGRKGVA